MEVVNGRIRGTIELKRGEPSSAPSTPPSATSAASNSTSTPKRWCEKFPPTPLKLTKTGRLINSWGDSRPPAVQAAQKYRAAAQLPPQASRLGPLKCRRPPNSASPAVDPTRPKRPLDGLRYSCSAVYSVNSVYTDITEPGGGGVRLTNLAREFILPRGSQRKTKRGRNACGREPGDQKSCGSAGCFWAPNTAYRAGTIL
jgi:hypothetical protein